MNDTIPTSTHPVKLRRAAVGIFVALALAGCSGVLPSPQRALGVCSITLRDGTVRPDCIYHDNGHFYCGTVLTNAENYGEGAWSAAVCDSDAEAPR